MSERTSQASTAIEEFGGVPLEHLFAWHADSRDEVHDGRIIERAHMTAGYNHINAIGNLYDILRPYARERGLGRVYGDGLTYILQQQTADGETRVLRSRIPDLSFVRYANIPKDFDHKRPFPGRPDLAVEVMSPTDQAQELLERVASYHAAGTEAVWAVYPIQREVHVYQRDEPAIIRVYREGDTLTAPTLFPELAISIARIFALDELESR